MLRRMHQKTTSMAKAPKGFPTCIPTDNLVATKSCFITPTPPFSGRPLGLSQALPYVASLHFITPPKAHPQALPKTVPSFITPLHKAYLVSGEE
jgi:hypothetical protein